MQEGSKVMDNDYSIVLTGSAGQGIQVVEKLAVNILKNAGYNVFAVKKYMSRVRGGVNSTEIRISSKKVRAYKDKIDILIPFNKQSLENIKERIDRDTLIILDEKIAENIDLSKYDARIFDFPISKKANEIKSKILINTVSTGILCSIFDIDFEYAESVIREYFDKKDKEIVENNIEAFKSGIEIFKNKGRDTPLKKTELDRNKSKKELLINGSEAIAYGSLAAGCNFVCAYPMSPSTEVLQLFAGHAEEFGVVVEQIEDEISAVNMAIGAWFGGARAMITTSGGGFALMAEGLSLAGMIESPLVMHVSQRPAPATGLPTRTAQEDLNLVVNAGHGEFPRIVYAPNTLEDGFRLAHKAFNLSDKYQIPVIILTDQYYVGSYYNFKIPDIDSFKNNKYFIKTDEDYKRHKLTENGISPRGIPGYGKGLIRTTGNEHLENGMITEDRNVRNKMQQKRNKKHEEVTDEFVSPKFYGSRNYDYLIVGWGSTYNIIREAVDNIDRDDISILHFSQVYPLNNSVKKYFNNIKKSIVVENNSTGQFRKLLKSELNIECDGSILKYDGRSFSVEGIKNQIQNMC